MTRIVTGNKFELGIKLTKDNKPFAIDPAYVIKTAVVSANNNQRYFDPVTIDPATPGIDLSQSLIIIQFTHEQTRQITKLGPAKIEIAITLNGVAVCPSWFVDVLVVKGQVNLPAAQP